MLSVRRTAGVRRGGTAGRGGEGVAGACPGGGEKLRGQVPCQPHHGQSGSGAGAEGGHGVRPAHPAGHSGRGGGDISPAPGRGVFGRAEPLRRAAAGDGRAAHGADGGAAGHRYAVCARGQRRRGHPGRRADRVRCDGCGTAHRPPEGRAGHDAGAPVDAGTSGPAPAGFCRRDGAGECEAGAGDRRRRRPQCAAGGIARRGQVHAGPAAAVHPAGHDPGGGPADHGDLFRGGHDRPAAPAGGYAALPQPPPHGVHRVALRRRGDTPAGRDIPGPQRRAVSGRAAGVQQGGAGDTAPAAGGRLCDHHPGLRLPDAAQPLHAGVRHEPLPLRLVRPPLRTLHLFTPAGGAVYAAHLRPAAGPDRYAHRCAVSGV